jgi:hypothetical protein
VSLLSSSRMENSHCSSYTSAYGVSAAQYQRTESKWRRFQRISRAPSPASVDFVVIFTHDTDYYKDTLPAPVHTDSSGFWIGQLSLRWITLGHQKSTNASTCGFFDSREAAMHRGISRQMPSLITQRFNLELTIAIEQWTPLSRSLAVRRNKDRTGFVSSTARN